MTVDPHGHTANTAATTPSRSLRDARVRADKLLRVDEPAIGPLNDLVRQGRSRDNSRAIPWVDPDGGGTGARVLVLMEAPGPRTVRDGDAGFCSEDNDDATAATLHDLRVRSGLPRDAYVRWNIVPWAVYDADGRWRAPTDQNLFEAAPALGELLTALPELRLVICMGAKALSGFMRHITLTDNPTPPLILGVPHPSQRNTRARAEALARIENAPRVAAVTAAR